MTKILVLLLALFAGQNALANTMVFDHSRWHDLLQRHVVLLKEGQASEVDYQGFADDKAQLDSYLTSLSGVTQKQFDAWPKNDQLAWLINAYNAWTVELILTKWPDLTSIKDLGSLFRSPWSKKFIPLLGEKRSLDNIEHTLIRGSDRYQDPRIHFAVNCASIGCPALANQAYQGDNLDKLLAQQTQLFLADRSRNRLQGDSLALSSIFKWYREDFEKGWHGYHSLEAFLLDHTADLALTPMAVEQLKIESLDIEFLDYDWHLNSKS
ncbi:DUF547 domain-containing protein [Marinomonas pollencensis]|uniref:Uncharacterized protein DUF547 n=1 Tax=Marinomonas pollencensis TaxID=491954 RepID=A0A3E0DKS6_9GAMM|nr:DUF547 domain-containing protein [Marinomonas pollencensis]REG83243.1 uncharacterized protein DUF547 [Marinomonas pollencensis]